MKRNTKKRRSLQIVSLVLLTFLMAMFVMSDSAEAAICERAFMSCMSDALAAGVSSWNLAILAAYATSCSLGYDWCLKYFKK